MRLELITNPVKVVIHEFKSSASAPLTPNQKIGFPKLYKYGGTIIGKGKGIFTNGYYVPAETHVKIIRPEDSEE